MKINTKSKLALGLALAMFATLTTTPVARAAEAALDDKDFIGVASADEKSFANELMEATKNEDYNAFMAHGDKGFKTITKAMFKSVSDQVKSRLKGGYHLVFLGGFKKTGYHETIWKVVYDAGGEEDKLDLSVRAGKIAGAILQ